MIADSYKDWECNTDGIIEQYWEIKYDGVQQTEFNGGENSTLPITCLSLLL